MLSGYGKREWLTILAIGSMCTATFLIVGWYWVVAPVLLVTLALLSFFRDPPRRVPTQRSVVVSPADGRVSSIHEVEHFELFDGPAICVRVFLSVLNVHVNRSPCHGVVESVDHRPGLHRNALNPESAQDNESTLLLLIHPVRRHPVAAVRQVAGLLARTIVCAVEPGNVLQRGQRFGMIKFGSTTELYLPQNHDPQILIEQGQKVYAGLTVLANVTSPPVEQSSHSDADPETVSSPSLHPDLTTNPQPPMDAQPKQSPVTPTS